jgi:hypothetical protein
MAKSVHRLSCQLMTQQGLQTLDMRHTLPNLKNLLLTLTSSLEDEESSLATQGNVHESRDAKDTATADTDTGARTPPRDNTPRKALFAPISGFWLSRGGSNAARTPNGLSAPPLSSSTLETRTSEQAEATAATLSPEPDVPVEHPLEERYNPKLPNGNSTVPKVNGLPMDSDTAISEESVTETAGTSVDDEGDTETIKDGTVGRAAAQGSWITKAFFGQIEKGPHGASVRWKRSTAATTLAAAATPGVGEVGRMNDTIVR